VADGWPDLIKQVKEANDIVDVVGAYLPLRKSGQKFLGLCPFHDDHRPSFSVDPAWQNFRCWSCNKYGDVITFVQEHERVTLKEAVELLARRVGLTIDKKGASPEDRRRALLLDVVHWAAEQYQRCLLDDPAAEDGRRYLGERGLTGETVRRFGLGFAPMAGDWLVQRAEAAGTSFDVLEELGLVAKRVGGGGYYDRFRDRVMFPIRDARGQTVGFGGRILPTSPYKDRAPKYYNSADSPLFSKSELLYGLDQARQAAAAAGYLAVVEGYTDVLMAHQLGVLPVVATMGTALNARHVRQLRRFAPRVVLVFDADAGGTTGVDRALEIFAGQDVDLAVATLPEGLDPCDLLMQRGPDAFREVLGGAVDALDFKLRQALAAENAEGVEGQRRAVDAVLGIIALAPELPGRAGAVKQELMLSRIAHRLGIREETVWARLKELRAQKRHREAPPDGPGEQEGGTGADKREPPAPPEERELMEVLLAEPGLVPVAAAQLPPERVRHATVRRLLEGLYRLHAAGEPPDLDRLRLQIDDPRLADYLLRLQEVGRHVQDRPAWLQSILAVFRERQAKSETQKLQNQLHGVNDHAEGLEGLRQLQRTKRDSCSLVPASGEAPGSG
jgi:DNA primase